MKRKPLAPIRRYVLTNKSGGVMMGPWVTWTLPDSHFVEMQQIMEYEYGIQCDLERGLP